MKKKLFVLLAALMITVTSTWAADTTRPTFNGDVTVSNITETGLTLSWNPATDDVTPQEELEYLVQKRERFQVDWITQVPFTANLTSYTATNLVSGTNYEFCRVLRPTGASVGQAASGYAVLHNGKAANNIVIGETYRGEAAVDAIENEAQTTGQHYTLDGRRVEGVPSRKGVYIVNGKKTVIM